jgi:hypothetical protein
LCTKQPELVGFNERFDLIWDEMMWYTYLLTAIGLTHGGSNTVHIYTQTIHGTTKRNKTKKK